MPAGAFVIVRHGETLPNRASQTCGSTDADVTARALEQAARLGRVLRRALADETRLYHTGMRRTLQTADALAAAFEPRPALQCAPSMRERCFGAWELQPWRATLAQIDAGAVPPQGETEAEFVDRSMRALTAIVAAAPTLPVIVAHGGTFHAIARHHGRRVRTIYNLDCYLFIPGDGTPITWQLSTKGSWRAASPFF